MGRCDQACGKIRAGFRKNIWYFVILGGLAAVNLIAALAGYLVAFGVVIIAGTAFYLNRKKQHVPVKEQVEQSEKAYRDLLAEEEEKDARKKAKEERKKKRRAEAEERRRQDRERSSSGKKKKEKQRDIIREDDDDEDYLARLQAIREGKSMNKTAKQETKDYITPAEYQKMKAERKAQQAASSGKKGGKKGGKKAKKSD